MKLLLDVGNTRLKWALAATGLQPAQALAHGGDPLACFARCEWPAVQQVWLACVPGQRDTARWNEVVQARCGVAPRIVLGAAQWQGLRSAYAQPEKLGVDRWLAMVALWGELRAPFCVAAAGTALTFDRVDAQGQHLGGLIAPGLGWSQRTLLKVTVTTGEAERGYHAGLGLHSEEAIRQGSFFAALGVLQNATRTPVPGERRYLTGGDAPALLPHLEPSWVQRPDLVLEGLFALARDAT